MSEAPLTAEELTVLRRQHVGCDHERTVRRLVDEIERLRRYHAPGCPVIADDESDAVLADYGQCACALAGGGELERQATEARRAASVAITERNGFMAERDRLQGATCTVDWPASFEGRLTCCNPPTICQEHWDALQRERDRLRAYIKTLPCRPESDLEGIPIGHHPDCPHCAVLG